MPETELQAILPTPPPGLPWPAKILWYAVDIAATTLLVKQFDYGAPLQLAAGGASGTPADEWRHIQIVAEDLVSQDTADDQVFTLDIVNFTGGIVDSSWTEADYLGVHTQIQNYCTAVSPLLLNTHRFKEARYYRRAFNPITESKPFPTAGPPESVLPLQIPCTGAAPLPPGCCTCITEETPSRKNWGRFYLPTLSASTLTSAGRLTQPNTQTFALTTRDFVQALHNAEFHVVVPTTSVGGRRNDALRGDYEANPVRTLQAVTGIRCDDVVDFQHRRRHRHALAKEILPTPGESATKPAQEAV